MRILVTGGAGFIGSHLCAALIARGDTVIALDNLYSGDIKNLQDLVDHQDFTFIDQDVTQTLDFKVDYIVNLACPASPVYYQKDPVSTVRTNVLGTLSVLELAKAINCPVLQASTSEVYGDPLVSPQKEDYLGNVNPIGIRACYDEGKRLAETLFFDYHRQYGVKMTVVRIFNTYGPRMRFDDGRVVSNFIYQSLNNEPLTIYGSGHQTRSFCYVSDLVTALMRVIDLQGSITGPINLGNPQEFTMRELAEIVLEKTLSRSQVVHLDLPSDDPRRRQPDISLAKNLLGWSPQVDLNTGLTHTIHDFKSRLGDRAN